MKTKEQDSRVTGSRTCQRCAGRGTTRDTKGKKCACPQCRGSGESRGKYSTK